MQFISNKVKATLTMDIFLNANIIFNNSDVLTDASVTFAT